MQPDSGENEEREEEEKGKKKLKMLEARRCLWEWWRLGRAFDNYGFIYFLLVIQAVGCYFRGVS